VCDLSPGQLPALNNLIDYMGALSGGNQMASLSINVGLVAASGTVTIASTGPTNSQTMGLNGYVLTAVTSSANPVLGQFNISATPATVATGLAAAVNGMTGLKELCSAVANGAVVTISYKQGGALGNSVKFANVNLSNASFSGSGTLASGSDGTAYTLSFS